MPIVSRVIRTSEQIRTDIEQILGFLPPFFEPARSTPLVMESLWQLTLLADIDSSLPLRFKQRLNASLARFCAVPYCMVCHASALHPLGMTGSEVLALLEAPLPLASEAEEHIAALNSSPILLTAFPDSESPQELALIACAAVIFLRGSTEEACRECVERVLGPDLFNSLSLFLAYIKTCHAWLDMHPDISYETDEQLHDCLGPLLTQSPTLGDFFRNCRENVSVLRFSQGERKVAVEVRQASERSQEILESITDAFYALDKEWRFTYINAGAEQIVRHTREELLGKIIWEAFPEAKDSVVHAQYYRAAAEGLPVSFEFFYPALDAWLAVRVYPSAEGISVFFQNVTERRAADEALRRQEAQREGEERNRLMVDALPHIAWTAGAEGIVDYFNPRWYAYTGLTFEESEAWGWEKAVHPEDLAWIVSSWKDAIQRGVTCEAEYRLRRQDGTYRLHLGRSEPVRIEGEIARWVGTATDIEDRQVAEEGLRMAHAQTAHAQTAQILASIADTFYTLDTEWRFTSLNPQAEITLRPRSELLGRVVWEEYPELIGTVFEEQYRRAVLQQIPVRFEAYYSPWDAWFEVRAYPAADGLTVLAQNVTERKRSEEALRRSEEQLRVAQGRLERMLTAGRVGTWSWDLVSDRIFADAEFARLFSLSPEDAAGGPISACQRVIHPDDQPRVSSAIAEFFAHPDTCEVEFRVQLAEGLQHWVTARGEVERNAEGVAITLSGVVVDITERIERERRDEGSFEPTFSI